MKLCKVYTIQENDEILPETDYYEVHVFNSEQPYVVSDSGEDAVLVESKVQCTPIRQFSEITELGTRMNTYVAFDKKLEGYIRSIIKEKEDDLCRSYNKKINSYQRDLDKRDYELHNLREQHFNQRQEFMDKWDNLLKNIFIASISLTGGVVLGILIRYYL